MTREEIKQELEKCTDQQERDRLYNLLRVTKEHITTLFTMNAEQCSKTSGDDLE